MYTGFLCKKKEGKESLDSSMGHGNRRENNQKDTKTKKNGGHGGGLKNGRS